MQSAPDIFVQTISDNCKGARLIMGSGASTRHKACPRSEGGQHQSSCYNSDQELYRAVSWPEDLTVSLDSAVLYLLKSPRKLNKYLSVLNVNVCQAARIVKLCKCKHKTPLCCQNRVVQLECPSRVIQLNLSDGCSPHLAIDKAALFHCTDMLKYLRYAYFRTPLFQNCVPKR